MLSASSDREVPPSVAAIAHRYRRLERLLSIALATVAVVAAVAVIVSAPFLAAVAFVVLLLGFLRIPCFEVSGTLELETNADPEAVLADFEGDTPPVLAFQ
ncbi:hypothetical protein [Natrarchaeobius oligotrophus]|uniref:Uncharacterized protein n=1 Tax=Natrarchaeobius chitinivorans TaxID=1679083 RepID=A0A3N6M783_NATCH|nr:hypothetical protein [Natrarchaeobius chitinivorans]RQG99478.1 hypothetical protein EA472_14755 [Natrarchaeobius chitinivorans]